MTTTRFLVLTVAAAALVVATVLVATSLLEDRAAAPRAPARDPGPRAVPAASDRSPAPGGNDRSRAAIRSAETGADPGGSAAVSGDEPVESRADVVGRLLDPNGAPVEGASVRLVFAGSEGPVASGTSGADGRFVLARAPARDGLSLEAAHEDYLPLSVPDVVVFGGVTLDLGDHAMSFGTRLEGIVIDPDDAPVAGATVSLGGPAIGARPVGADGRRSKTTGPDGRFRFSGLSAGDFFLFARAEGFTLATTPPVSAKEGERVANLRIRLQRGLVVAGRVVGPDGAAVAGASVRVSTAGPEIIVRGTGATSGVGGVRTDERGEFRVTSAPSGPCRVEVTADGFARSETSTTGGTTDLLVTLALPGAIEGIAIDAVTGDPVAGEFEAWTEIEAEGPFRLRMPGLPAGEKENRVRVAAGSGGRFRIEGLDPGRYVVGARAKGSAEAKSDPVSVDPAPAVAQVVLRLERGGSIFGVVREEGTSAPIAGASVRAIPFSPGGDAAGDLVVISRGAGEESMEPLLTEIAASAETDARGEFALEELATGSYRVVASHPTHARGDLAGLGVAAGLATGPITITLGAAGAVEGWVTGIDGRPIEGAPVSVRDLKGTSKNAKTGADGYYRVENLTPGSYVVKREPETEPGMRFVAVMRRSGSDGFQPPPEGIPVDVLAGQVVRVDFSDADLGAFSGRVVEGDKGVAGATVHLSPRGAFALPMVKRTDEEGRFEYERLDPGAYTFEVRVPPETRALVTEAVELVPGRSVEKDVPLPTGSIEGAVLDRLSRDPIEGARVSIEPLGEERTPGVRMSMRFGGGPEGIYTGRDGKFRIPRVGAGKYRVSAAKDGYGQESVSPVQIMEAGDVAAGVEIQLGAGGVLVGRVSDAATDQPLSSAFVSARDADGSPLLLGGSVSTDSDGRFRLSGVRPGRVLLQVFRPEYEHWSGEAEVAGRGESTVTIRLSRSE